jgi:hypothetical protein
MPSRKFITSGSYFNTISMKNYDVKLRVETLALTPLSNFCGPKKNCAGDKYRPMF